MKIDTLKRQESYYKEETEKARLEMVKAIKEKDKVLFEIADQRKWVSTTNKILNIKDSEKISLIRVIDSLEVAVKQKRGSFYEITDGQKIILDKTMKEISWMLSKKDNLISEVDKYTKNTDLMKEKSEKVKILSSEIEWLEIKKEAIDTYINSEKEQLKSEKLEFEKEKEDFVEYEKAVRKKEDKLNIKETRLKNVKKNLPSKK